MRVKITIYKNSVLATVCSLLGTAFAALGLLVMFSSGILSGLGALLLGIGLMFLASWISDKRKFPAWKRKVQESGLIPEIQSSVQVAIQVYRTNPCPQALEFIRTLNPQAAHIIEQAQTSRSGN